MKWIIIWAIYKSVIDPCPESKVNIKDNFGRDYPALISCSMVHSHEEFNRYEYRYFYSRDSVKIFKLELEKAAKDSWIFMDKIRDIRVDSISIR